MEAYPRQPQLTPKSYRKNITGVQSKGRLTMALHHAEELDNDLRRGSDEDLTLAPSLGIDNVVLQDINPRTEHVRQNNSRGSRSSMPSVRALIPRPHCTSTQNSTDVPERRRGPWWAKGWVEARRPGLQRRNPRVSYTRSSECRATESTSQDELRRQSTRRRDRRGSVDKCSSPRAQQRRGRIHLERVLRAARRRTVVGFLRRA